MKQLLFGLLFLISFSGMAQKDRDNFKLLYSKSWASGNDDLACHTKISKLGLNSKDAITNAVYQDGIIYLYLKRSESLWQRIDEFKVSLLDSTGAFVESKTIQFNTFAPKSKYYETISTLPIKNVGNKFSIVVEDYFQNVSNKAKAEFRFYYLR